MLHANTGRSVVLHEHTFRSLGNLKKEKAKRKEKKKRDHGVAALCILYIFKVSGSRVQALIVFKVPQVTLRCNTNL